MKKLSEKRILQITNDINEGMCLATREQLFIVVNYWQQHYNDREEEIRIVKAQDRFGELLKKLDDFGKQTKNESQK